MGSPNRSPRRRADEPSRPDLYDFYKIAHEHRFVFRKPLGGEDVRGHKLSTKR